MRIWGGPLLVQSHQLMHTERLSVGGNIRDKTFEDLEELVYGGGQLWGWVSQKSVLSVCTLEPKHAERPWWYVNNGVTRADVRGRGLSFNLIRTAVEMNERPGVGFIVIYIRQNLFERLGFREINIDQLRAIDEPLAMIIAGKLRAGKEAHVLIKIGQTYARSF